MILWWLCAASHSIIGKNCAPNSARMLTYLGLMMFSSYHSRYLERCVNFAKRANAGVTNVYRPALLLIGNKLPGEECEVDLDVSTNQFFESWGEDAKVIGLFLISAIIHRQISPFFILTNYRSWILILAQSYVCTCLIDDLFGRNQQERSWRESKCLMSK